MTCPIRFRYEKHRIVSAVFITEDDPVRVTVYALHLPGVVVQAKHDEALKTFVDAFNSAAGVYKEYKQEIPFTNSEEDFIHLPRSARNVRIEAVYLGD